MRKKLIVGIILIIGLVGIGFVMRYFLDPINNPRIAHDLKKGDVFELKDDAFIYYYLNEKQAILPASHYRYSFSVDEFRKNPDLGVSDKEAGCYIREILTKGTLIKFTRIGRRFGWNEGAYYIYYGKIISGQYSSEEELNIGHLLFLRSDRTDSYLDKK